MAKDKSQPIYSPQCQIQDVVELCERKGDRLSMKIHRGLDLRMVMIVARINRVAY